MPESAATWPTIAKPSWPAGVVPNVVDYDATRRGFSWDDARGRLDGLPGDRGLNIAHEAVDRHAAGPGADRVALRWLRRDGRVTEATYAALSARTNQFANALRSLDVGRGDRVFVLSGRIPELYVNLVTALHEQTGIDVPERDYAALDTVDGFVGYVVAASSTT